jgi:dolichol-phosphate mannosyltransferase
VEGGGVSDWSAVRRGLSRGAQLLGLLVLPGVVSRVSDPMSGLFMVRRAALQGVTLSPLGYKILIEVLGRGRIQRIAEVGYVFCERTAGESKVSSRLYVEYLAHLFRLRLATLPPRFLMYALVGFSGVFIDMGMLFLLSDVVGLGLGVSKACAVETAIVSNFLLNDVWTFGDLTVGRRGGAARLKRFLKFNAVCGVGLVLSVALLTLQVSLLGLNQYLANAIAILLVTVWNFWMNKTFSWAAGPVSKPTAI